MQTSPYVQTLPAILAEMEQDRQEDGNLAQPEQDGEPVEKMFVYRTDTGGWLVSPTKIGEQETSIEADEPQAPLVDAQESAIDQRPITRKEPPYFLHFLLFLLVFVCFDNVDTFLTLLAPIVTVTITPLVKTISTSATVPIGGSATAIQGRVLAPLTLTQSQTVQATGKGHQDAQLATGTILYFNGSFAPQSIDAGTVYAGRDGVQVVTNETVTIPAATPGNPPQFGQATVAAHAKNVGASGNIPAGDISITGSTLQVSNSQFHNGQDARDFSFVTKEDIQQAMSALTPNMLQSEQAALHAQVTPQEQLVTPTCTRTVTSNHQPQDEATEVNVSVSETCSAVVYNKDALQTQATAILTHQARKQLGAGYRLVGTVQVTVTQAAPSPHPTLVFLMHGTWVSAVSVQTVTRLVAGKPRLRAIRLLKRLPGVQSVAIAGIADNSTLPDDLSHIHVLILVQE
jgi:hypothetical protein